MEEIGFFAQLQHDINILDLKNFIFIALLFYIPFHFSKKAETLFFHLLYSFFGIYMLATMEDVRVIYDLKMLVGLGLLIPQVKFIIQFTQETIQTVKMMTANTYYFFITIYYKILRFIHWIKSTYIMLKIFFTTFSFKKEDYYEQEHSSQRNYSHEQKEEQTNYSKQENQQSYTSDKKDNSEYARLYASDSYVVLGVSRSDSKEVIKKARNQLLKKYHTDKNYKKSPEELKIYLEITKNINRSWDEIARDLKRRE